MMNRSIGAFVSAVFLVIFSTLSVSAETYSEGYFRYKITNNQVVITEYFGNEEIVTIPTTIAGMNVVGIGAYAFKSSNIQRIIVPEYVTDVSSNAFANASGLTTIIVKADRGVIPELSGVIVVEDKPEFIDITTAESSTRAEKATEPTTIRETTPQETTEEKSTSSTKETSSSTGNKTSSSEETVGSIEESVATELEDSIETDDASKVSETEGYHKESGTTYTDQSNVDHVSTEGMIIEGNNGLEIIEEGDEVNIQPTVVASGEVTDGFSETKENADNQEASVMESESSHGWIYAGSVLAIGVVGIAIAVNKKDRS